MEYNRSEFKNLMFNVLVNDTGVSFLKKYPVLKQHKEFTVDIGDLDFNSVFTYIACCYDKESPLIHAPNIKARKMEAARLAEFPTKKGKIAEGYERVIRCKNPVVNRMIIRYCRMQNDVDFSTAMMYNEKLYDQLEKMLNNSDDEKTKDLIDNTQKLKQHIKDTARSFLNYDDAEDLELSLYEEMELELMELRPEDIARKTKEGEKPFAE